jgi:hypothetical protein
LTFLGFGVFIQTRGTFKVPIKIIKYICELLAPKSRQQMPLERKRKDAG